MLVHSRHRESIISGIVIASLAAVAWFGVSWYRDAAPCCESGVVSLAALIPLDRQVRTGRLRNGLTYFVRQNDWPDNRVELRLIVNAGSVLEDDDQRGLAHAVEHMAFRGTRRFPRNAIVSYLERLGGRNGDDVNAHTSQDETTYELSIPADRPGALDTAITILAEWAHEVTFDSAGARQEAGVVFEEWRSKDIASRRLSHAQDFFLLAGSRYADRPVIGDTTVLRLFDLTAMHRFYRDWYRPELMAVVVVGDVDADAVEALVRKRLGAIPASDTTRPRTAERGVLSRISRAITLTDPEAASTNVALWYLRPRAPMVTVADYRESLVADLWSDVVDLRLEKASRSVEAPLLRAHAWHDSYTRALDAFVVQGTVLAGRLDDGVGMLAEHVTSLAAFDPTPSELEDAKKTIENDRTYVDSHGRSSIDVADRLTAHFLTGSPVFEPEQDYDITKSLLSRIEAKDLTRFAKGIVSGNDGAIVVTAPDMGESTPASTRATSALLAAARHGALLAGRPDTTTELAHALITSTPRAGSVVAEKLYRDLGAFEWTLSNGMRVIIKRTAFADAEVQVRITSPAGSAIASEAEYQSASYSDDVVQAMGVGPLTGAQLETLIDHTSISLSPSISNAWLQLSGQAELKDVETFFQLAHLFLTAPRKDASAFRRYQERLRQFWAERSVHPDAVFDDSVAAAGGRRPPGYVPSLLHIANQVDLETAMRFWRARAANASNFTTVIVGDITLERARRLVSTYLASLPPGHHEKAAPYAGIRASGPTQREFHFGRSAAGRTQFLFSGTLQNAVDDEGMVWRVNELLQMALENRLREFMGATYGVETQVSIQPTNAAQFQFTVDFAGDPTRLDTLARVALAEIDRLRTAGPTQDEFEKVKAAASSDIERSSRYNSYWADALTWRAVVGAPLGTGRERATELELLTRVGLRDACARYIDTGGYLRLTMKPLPEIPRPALRRR